MKEFLVYFASTLLALLSAGFVWLLRLIYEKHKMEMLALAKFERLFVKDITILKDNFDFIDEWISVLAGNKRYKCCFINYCINEEDTYKITNLELVNKIFSINYKLHRTGLDVDNIYTSSNEEIVRIISIQDSEKKQADLEVYFKDLIGQLTKIKTNYDYLQNDLINIIALIRCYYKVRKHSFFGYLSVLFIDVLPRLNENKIKKEVSVIKANIKKSNE